MSRPRPLVFALVALGFVFCLSDRLHAENKYHVFTVSPFVGGRLVEGNQPIDGSVAGGLAIGYNFSEVWSAEGVLAYAPSEQAGRDAHVIDARLDVLYHFTPYGRLVPYVALGVGGLFIKTEGRDADDDLQVNFGGGVKYFITEDIALRADIRPLLDINVGDGGHTPDTYWNLLCTAGVVVQLDTPQETRVYLDTDEDGVLDAVDECLETPPGAPVTRRGCSRDIDRDGVPDYRDLCPETPEGTVVTAAGCPAPPRGDRDSDGVEDRLDHCPDTPLNVPVNAVGCPLKR